MKKHFLLLLLGLMSINMAIISGCNRHHSKDVEEPATATIEGPITGTPTLVSTFFSLESVGYEQAEYFISGTANSYRNVNELHPSGEWQVEAADQAAFTTRIIVYRPISPADFNGTVVVEWPNVSAGFESAPEWGLAHTEFIRRGYAWVAASSQAVGINHLKDNNASRYGDLIHPGDSFSYDIYAQIAQAIKHPKAIAPLGRLNPQRLIAAGESQSAHRLMTYANSFGNTYDVYDGFFIHSRLGGSAALSQSPQADIPTPDAVYIREDLNKPVLMLQTETDIFLLGSFNNRQNDSDSFRLWEAAGTAHADLYTAVTGFLDIGNNPAIAAVIENSSPVPGFLDCAKPVNAGPQHFITKAAFSALNQWIIDGTVPPSADRLATIDDNNFLFDTLGNVKGGIRSPYVDAPIAIFSGTGQDGSSFCRLFGTTQLFNSSTLSSLYADNEAYIRAVNNATDDAVAKGFIVAEDGDLIKAHAAATNIFSL
ncbi:alpha/beta hydrolase domain-containing protein [Oceanicoccus sp. KOV_DT_Chl]|uniref:alpha/beta hydrolase domain-containing protein n=1 Tax=Oceanicoccus sp. KOV_DT_Chl TaxID=1904639 RepID=UPI000C7B0C2B|nr:alpha/beta hydrolase domain-containing protein [Oceanicoccus sp. KOV_DT_Chl]